jgi:hypothetical protein
MKTTRDITIPAGTILYPSPNERRGYYEATVGFGPDFTGYLVVQPHADAFASGYFKRDTKADSDGDDGA